MRQRVTLYIDGQKADLTVESLILFTYTAEETDNPSVVVNSYTRTLSLPATRANDIIFDKIAIHTHNVRVGAFSPIVRTPFAIIGSTGERLETGYLKLDNIVYEGKSHHYDVTLYGGLGGLLYSLMYDSAGRERTLADMDYSGTAGLADADFTFTINVDSVFDAWQQLCRSIASDDRWKHINFAPMYNGIPEGFDANKAFVTYRQIEGLGSGDSIITTFAEAVDEWQIKDLRSYLQRPVIKVQSIIDTIIDEAAALGYTLNVGQSLYDLLNDVWMTLPRLSTLLKNDEDGGQVEIAAVSSVSFDYGINKVYVPAYTPSLGASNYREDITMQVALTFSPSGTFVANNTYYLAPAGSGANIVYIFQLVAYNSGGTAIGASPIVTVSQSSSTAAILAAVTLDSAFVNPTENIGESVNSNITATSTTSAKLDSLVTLRLTAYDAAYYRVQAQRADLGGGSADVVWVDNSTSIQVRAHLSTSGTDDWQSSGLRTGATITKALLLGSTMSPAAFLLGIVRIYGAKVHYDSVTKTMSVLSRDDYYSVGIIDLNGRIDHAQERTAIPYVFQHRFYRWALQGLGAEAKEYEDKYLHPYGSMTADTSFPFDNETEKVLEGIPFSTCAHALHRDVTFNLVSKGGYVFPSPFLLGGAKYKNGDTEDNVPTITSEYGISPVNHDWPAYDYYPKSEMEDDSRKGIDAFVLLRYYGRGQGEAYGYMADYIRLTDDIPQLLYANNGKPCWRYDIGSGLLGYYVITDALTDEPTKAPLPLFGRMTGIWNTGVWEAVNTLEMAVPAELSIPKADTSALTGIYEDMWRKFVEDRYDVDTRKVTARVFWRGLRVDASALRSFYAFDGCLWVCTKIQDYALTSEQPTLCEFVKVKDLADYTAVPPTPPTPPTPPEPPTPQRVDLATPTWTSGRYCKSDTGGNGTSSNYSVTNYLDVSGAAGKTLYYSRVKRSSSTATTGMAFYDSGGTYISGEAPAYGGANNTYVDGEILVPLNAATVRFTGINAYITDHYAYYYTE